MHRSEENSAGTSIATESNRDHEILLFEAEDKDAAAFFGKTGADNLIPWARNVSGDTLYATSRHLLKVDFVREIVEGHAAVSGHDPNQYPYADLLRPPVPHTAVLQAAHALLTVAVTICPTHYGAWFNLAIAEVRSGRLEAAVRAFSIAAEHGGRVAHYALWYRGDALWDLGQHEAAARSYAMGFAQNPHILGVMAARAARRLRSMGEIDLAMQMFDATVSYSHTNIPEFVHLAYAQELRYQLVRLDPAPAVCIEVTSPQASALVGMPASIWQMENRFYAVPDLLGTPAPAQLTRAGIAGKGMAARIEQYFAASAFLRLIIGPIISRLLPGLWTRCLRRVIRSAETPEGLVAHNSSDVGGLAPPSSVGLYDPLGLFYAIYQSVGDGPAFVAVPVRLEPFAPEEINVLDRFGQGWRGLIDRAVDKWPRLYRYGHPVIRRILPGVARRFLRRRVRMASTWPDLVEQLEQADSTGHGGTSL